MTLDSGLIPYTSGFGVIFKVGPPGAATILGGEGDAATGRYDVSSENGYSRVVLRIESAGAIEVNASIPQCGVLPYSGRYSPALPLDPAVTIMGE